jgi:hypothetical protein
MLLHHTFPNVFLLLHKIYSFCPFGGMSNNQVNPSFQTGQMLWLTTWQQCKYQQPKTTNISSRKLLCVSNKCYTMENLVWKADKCITVICALIYPALKHVRNAHLTGITGCRENVQHRWKHKGKDRLEEHTLVCLGGPLPICRQQNGFVLPIVCFKLFPRKMVTVKQPGKQCSKLSALS